MGVDCLDFYRALEKNNLDFFTGVPDSLLKQICLCIDEKAKVNHHIIAANEGTAVAIASGYHLGTGKIPVVYMQNSGLGNAINPLLSLCDPEVYSIPMIVMIGWRGEPGVKDEPQHVKQGKVQVDLLNSLNLPFSIISKDEKNINSLLSDCIKRANSEKSPHVLLIKKGTFNYYNNVLIEKNNKKFIREKALEIILDSLPKDAIIISTTGVTSREIFEIRERNDQKHNKDFLTVGSMGHSSSIALGLAVANPERKVFCIDGDGSIIMHMGSLSVIGDIGPKNFYHILINNESHESVGGQSTSAKNINFSDLVKANNYKKTYKTSTEADLVTSLSTFSNLTGPSFLEVKVSLGHRKKLGRPTIKPVENKKSFMKFVKKDN